MKPQDVKPERAPYKTPAAVAGPKAPDDGKASSSRATSNQPTFDELVRSSGLHELRAEASLVEVDARLSALASQAAGVDARTLALLRVDTVRRLKAAGVESPAKLVDVYLPHARPSADDSAKQGRALPFDPPNPWPDPVSTGDLLTKLVTTLARYLVLPQGAATAVALWTLHTHAFDAAQITARLAIVSPVKRCGKSTLLKLLGAMTRRPLPTANTTPAAVFRVIEAHAPTLLVDEADTFLGENEELRGVLNAGHDRQSATVIRCVGEDSETRAFCVWAPVAIAAIGKLPDTLMDRSIVIIMNRKATAERVRSFRRQERDAIAPLRRKCERWANDESASLAEARPMLPNELNDRAADNWEALFAIADAAGEPWSSKARRAALVLSGERDEEEEASQGEALLADVRAIFDARSAERLATKTLLDDLAKLEGRPWAEATKGKPLSSHHMARHLRRFRIKSRTIRLEDGSTPKGYHRGDFADAWTRYLPKPATIATSSTSLGNSTNLRPPHESRVADAIQAKRTRSSADVADVAAPNGAAPSAQASLSPNTHAQFARKDTRQ